VDSTVSYRYDKFNRVTAKIHGDGTREKNGYDAYGRPVSLKVVSSTGKLLTQIEYKWDAAGQLCERSRDGISQKYEYDGAGQLTSVHSEGQSARLSKGSDIPEESYSYDIAGNLIEKKIGGQKTLYTYDMANRLTASHEYTADGSEVSSKQCVYDALGRLIEEKKDGDLTRFEYGMCLIADGHQQFVSTQVEAEPRVINLPTIRIDCRGWFGKVSAVIKLGRHTRMEYEYNPLGQLARKVARGGMSSRSSVDLASGAEQNTQNQALDTQSGSTDFFWDGLALIQRGDESYLTENHISGGIPVNISREVREGTQREQATQESSSFVGQAARLPQAGPQGHGIRSATEPVALQHAVVISDFLGTTLGTVSSGQFAPVHLTAFGEQIATDPLSDIPSSLSDNAVFYTGKPYDEDLQAYHFLYRNYSPTQARWTAADPSGFPDGPNQWLYVNNGVMNKVDALGLSMSTLTGTFTPTLTEAAQTQSLVNAVSAALTSYNLGTKTVNWINQQIAAKINSSTNLPIQNANYAANYNQDTETWENQSVTVAGSTLAGTTGTFTISGSPAGVNIEVSISFTTGVTLQTASPSIISTTPFVPGSNASDPGTPASAKVGATLNVTSTTSVTLTGQLIVGASVTGTGSAIQANPTTITGTIYEF